MRGVFFRVKSGERGRGKRESDHLPPYRWVVGYGVVYHPLALPRSQRPLNKPRDCETGVVADGITQ